MATPAHRLIRDQNLNFLYNGATPMEKTDVTKPSKKGGGLGGRKALNDISNSSKPSALQSIKKDNPAKVIPVEKDPFNRKVKAVKASEKGKIGGRKALSDLTNSVKPFSQQMSKKLTAVSENIPSAVIAEEGFLHNHHECIKAQIDAVDMNYFLESVGLSNEIPVQRSSAMAASLKKAESKKKDLEMEEISEQVFEDQVARGCLSPVCNSPKSPKPPYMNWEEESLYDLMVIESPKLLKF